MSSISITIPRSLATPLGILPRESSARLDRADLSWLYYNINNRMTRDQQIELSRVIQTEINR